MRPHTVAVIGPYKEWIRFTGARGPHASRSVTEGHTVYRYISRPYSAQDLQIDDYKLLPGFAEEHQRILEEVRHRIALTRSYENGQNHQST